MQKPEKLKAFERLLNVMDDLREKCPWDREQTFASLRNLTIEEVYELADAIMEKDTLEIKKELGDIALHIVFYAKIAEEQKEFDIADVLNAVCEKLIFRHPHVYGNVEVNNNSEKVKNNWEDLKMKEGNRSVLAGVPDSLPALIKANRVQEKVRAIGFDWDKREQVWEKVQEELQELQHEIDAHNADKMEAEFGDLLFSVVNAARLYGVDPETALERTNKKFMKRFKFLEKETLESGQKLRDMSLDEMNVVWEKAKESDD